MARTRAAGSGSADGLAGRGDADAQHARDDIGRRVSAAFLPRYDRGAGRARHGARIAMERAGSRNPSPPGPFSRDDWPLGLASKPTVAGPPVSQPQAAHA